MASREHWFQCCLNNTEKESAKVLFVKQWLSFMQSLSLRQAKLDLWLEASTKQSPQSIPVVPTNTPRSTQPIQRRRIIIHDSDDDAEPTTAPLKSCPELICASSDSCVQPEAEQQKRGPPHVHLEHIDFGQRSIQSIDNEDSDKAHMTCNEPVHIHVATDHATVSGTVPGHTGIGPVDLLNLWKAVPKVSCQFLDLSAKHGSDSDGDNDYASGSRDSDSEQLTDGFVTPDDADARVPPEHRDYVTKMLPITMRAMTQMKRKAPSRQGGAAEGIAVLRNDDDTQEKNSNSP